MTTKPTFDKLDPDVQQHLLDVAQSYGADEFRAYCEYIEWEDWMYSFLDDPDEDEVSEMEWDAINQELFTAFEYVHQLFYCPVCGERLVEHWWEPDYKEARVPTHCGQVMQSVPTTVTRLLKLHQMTQTALANRFGIPLRSVQHWAEGTRTPPPYLVPMMDELLTHDATDTSESKRSEQRRYAELICDKLRWKPYRVNELVRSNTLQELRDWYNTILEGEDSDK